MDYPEMNRKTDGDAEDLIWDNEIRKLKLQAEYGAVIGKGNTELEPELEHIFLNQVEAFEEAWSRARQVSVWEHVGRPSFPAPTTLQDEELEGELQRILRLLRQHCLEISVSGTYPPRTMYRFLVEELMPHQFDYIPVEGMITTFVYEEFHPDHHRDISDTVEEFISLWMERLVNPLNYVLHRDLLSPEGTMLPGGFVLGKIRQVFDSFASFSLDEMSLEEVEFSFDRDKEEGRGTVQGQISYIGRLESGEQLRYAGNFLFRMKHGGYGWLIESFQIPGFTWSALWIAG